MIKEYELDGYTFQTITLPPATVLFRGLHYQTEKYSIFSDLLGYYGEGFKLSPTHNVFFYPAPTVSEYNIHSIYLTNYTVELILLVKPAHLHRGSHDGPLIQCSMISDKCGHEMKTYDPCIKENVFNTFPQIAGFISISEKDTEHFLKLYKRLLHKGKFSKLRQILPSIITNSRDLTSVPEIVLYPLHNRMNECVIRSEIYNIKSAIDYCINNKAQFNYFPLLYINERNVYSFTDLNDTLLARIRSDERIKMGILHRILLKLLSPTGYKINGICYRFTIDFRTGFFIADTGCPLNKTVKRARGKVSINGTIVPFNYSLADKSRILNTVGFGQLYDMDELEKTVNHAGFSVRNSYVFNKGHPKRYLTLEKMVERRDLRKKI
jgi:hypothetical protein